MSISSATRLPSRYDASEEFGGDPILHDSYFYIEIAGARFTINPSIYPAMVVLAGVALIVLGIYLMLHVNTGISFSDI